MFVLRDVQQSHKVIKADWPAVILTVFISQYNFKVNLWSILNRFVNGFFLLKSKWKQKEWCYILLAEIQKLVETGSKRFKLLTDGEGWQYLEIVNKSPRSEAIGACSCKCWSLHVNCSKMRSEQKPRHSLMRRVCPTKIFQVIYLDLSVSPNHVLWKVLWLALTAAASSSQWEHRWGHGVRRHKGRGLNTSKTTWATMIVLFLSFVFLLQSSTYSTCNATFLCTSIFRRKEQWNCCLTHGIIWFLMSHLVCFHDNT